MNYDQSQSHDLFSSHEINRSAGYGSETNGHLGFRPMFSKPSIPAGYLSPAWTSNILGGEDLGVHKSAKIWFYPQEWGNKLYRISRKSSKLTLFPKGGGGTAILVGQNGLWTSEDVVSAIFVRPLQKIRMCPCEMPCVNCPTSVTISHVRKRGLLEQGSHQFRRSPSARRFLRIVDSPILEILGTPRDMWKYFKLESKSTHFLDRFRLFLRS